MHINKRGLTGRVKENPTIPHNARKKLIKSYNTSFVYCRELAPGTVGLTGDWVRGDDSK